MKKHKLTVPISMTATLAFILTCSLSCGRKTNLNLAPAETPAVGDNQPAVSTNAAVTVLTNLSTPAEPATTTNPPPATAATSAAAMTLTTPDPAPTAAPVIKVVEMPATVPTAPTNFYTRNFTTDPGGSTNECQMQPASNYYFRFRVGYEHINHGDNNDTYTLGVKFYAAGDDLRERVGKNAWLIPDAAAEVSFESLPKTDLNRSPGSDQGTRFRAEFFWPWMHWSTRVLARTNALCPFEQPLAFRLGPTVNLGFDEIAGDADYRFARYVGARLTLNHDGFIEYTVGETDGLNGTRQQVVAELPVYQSHNGEVRYVLRGLWNRGDHSQPDVLQGGMFLEMPFGTLVKPSKWSDLIPCRQ